MVYVVVDAVNSAPRLRLPSRELGLVVGLDTLAVSVAVEDTDALFETDELAGIAARVVRDGDRIAACTIGATGFLAAPGRLPTVEALVGEGAPERGLRALLVDEDTTAAEDDTAVEATVTR